VVYKNDGDLVGRPKLLVLACAAWENVPTIQKGCAMSVAEVTHDSSPRSTRAGQVAIVLTTVLAIVLVVLIGWWVLVGRHQAVPFTVEGWATPSNDGTAISLSSEPGGTGEGYIIAGAAWSEGGPWHEGSDVPTCIGNDPNVITRIRMGVIHVQTDPSPANTVVWIECLPA